MRTARGRRPKAPWPRHGDLDDQPQLIVVVTFANAREGAASAPPITLRGWPVRAPSPASESSERLQHGRGGVLARLPHVSYSALAPRDRETRLGRRDSRARWRRIARCKPPERPPARPPRRLPTRQIRTHDEPPRCCSRSRVSRSLLAHPALRHHEKQQSEHRLFISFVRIALSGCAWSS